MGAGSGTRVAAGPRSGQASAARGHRNPIAVRLRIRPFECNRLPGKVGPRTPMAPDEPVTTAAEEVPLLPLIARGQAGAVNACVRRYGPLVWSWARRMSPSRADAEDAVQEIFMQLWKSAATFDANRCSERGFVALIARRRLIDRLRSLRTRRGREVALDPVELDEHAAAGVHSEPDAHKAAQLIAALPEERRTVLMLFLADGCSHSEISERTGMPLGTVKSVVRRSLLLIREQLGLRVDGGLRKEGAR